MPLFVTLFDITMCLGDLFPRVTAIHNSFDRTRLDQFFKKDKIFDFFAR